MFVSTVLAERLIQLCEDSGASRDERLAALQIAITLSMRGFSPIPPKPVLVSTNLSNVVIKGFEGYE